MEVATATQWTLVPRCSIARLCSRAYDFFRPLLFLHTHVGFQGSCLLLFPCPCRPQVCDSDINKQDVLGCVASSYDVCGHRRPALHRTCDLADLQPGIHELQAVIRRSIWHILSILFCNDKVVFFTSIGRKVLPTYYMVKWSGLRKVVAW